MKAKNFTKSLIIAVMRRDASIRVNEFKKLNIFSCGIKM
jgi:hypothetical protein